MKRIYILFALVLIFTASSSYAAGKYKLLEATLFKADKLVVKTSAVFAGPILNDTKTRGQDNPVTIKDNVVVAGNITTKNLKVSGSSPFIQNLSCASGQIMKYGVDSWACGSDTDTDTDSLGGLHCSSRDSIYWTGLSWACINPINNYPDPNLSLELRRTTMGTALSLNNHSDIQTYLELDTLPYNVTTPSMSCTPTSLTQGSMIVDYGNNKLWICMSSGWKSFTSD